MADQQIPHWVAWSAKNGTAADEIAKSIGELHPSAQKKLARTMQLSLTGDPGHDKIKGLGYGLFELRIQDDVTAVRAYFARSGSQFTLLHVIHKSEDRDSGPAFQEAYDRRDQLEDQRASVVLLTLDPTERSAKQFVFTPYDGSELTRPIEEVELAAAEPGASIRKGDRSVFPADADFLTVEGPAGARSNERLTIGAYTQLSRLASERERIGAIAARLKVLQDHDEGISVQRLTPGSGDVSIKSIDTQQIAERVREGLKDQTRMTRIKQVFGYVPAAALLLVSIVVSPVAGTVGAFAGASLLAGMLSHWKAERDLNLKRRVMADQVTREVRKERRDLRDQLQLSSDTPKVAVELATAQRKDQDRVRNVAALVLASPTTAFRTAIPNQKLFSADKGVRTRADSVAVDAALYHVKYDIPFAVPLLGEVPSNPTQLGEYRSLVQEVQAVQKAIGVEVGAGLASDFAGRGPSQSVSR